MRIVLSSPPITSTGAALAHGDVYLLDKDNWNIEAHNARTIATGLPRVTADDYAAARTSLKVHGKVFIEDAIIPERQQDLFLELLLKDCSIRTFMATGIEGTWVHAHFFVGRAYAERESELNFPANHCTHAEWALIAGSTLGLMTGRLTARPAASGIPTFTLPVPIQQHDLFMLFPECTGGREPPKIADTSIDLIFSGS